MTKTPVLFIGLPWPKSDLISRALFGVNQNKDADSGIASSQILEIFNLASVLRN